MGGCGSLVTWIANTLVPGTNQRLMSISVANGRPTLSTTFEPFTERTNRLSASTKAVATRNMRPAGITSLRRKYRVPAGTPTAGLPSGNQIQLQPRNAGCVSSPPSKPIHLAFQSSGFSNPMDHRAGWLHEEGRPASSQILTFHQQTCCDTSGLPA